MPYTADISRANPACFLFLVDQSGSMTQALAGQTGQRKMDQAAAAINRILDTVAQRCSQGMDIHDYFDIGVIGYTGAAEISSLLKGTAPKRPFCRLTKLSSLRQQMKLLGVRLRV